MSSTFAACLNVALPSIRHSMLLDSENQHKVWHTHTITMKKESNRNLYSLKVFKTLHAVEIVLYYSVNNI